MKIKVRYREEDEIEILHTYVNRSKNTLSAIFEMSSSTYSKIRRLKNKQHIGIQRCPVYDEFDMSRCSNCSRYGHGRKKCRNSVTCRHCGDNHESSSCTNQQTPVCCNCVEANQNQNSRQRAVNHSADDVHKCEVYNRRLRRDIEQTDYPLHPIVPGDKFSNLNHGY